MAGEATSVDDSDVVFRSPSISVIVPYVLLSRKYTKRSKIAREAKFSRRGIMVRDGYICVYCRNRADTIDHVIPRMDGGISSYDNCVAACTSCNRKKGHKSLRQMHWKLPEIPKAPSLYSTMLGRVMNNEEHFNAWSPYILAYEPRLSVMLENRLALQTR